LLYLGVDVEKHYRAACVLDTCLRQTGDKSLQLFSLVIREQALSLLREKTDDHDLCQTITLHVLAAVQSEPLGFLAMAMWHKSAVQRLMAQRPVLKGCFPVMDKDENKLYDSLPTQMITVDQKMRSRKRR
jgi:hypothetical protein